MKKLHFISFYLEILFFSNLQKFMRQRYPLCTVLLNWLVCVCVCLSLNGKIASAQSPSTLDPNFYADVDNALLTSALQNDGKILVAGPFTQVNRTPRSRLARLHQNGTLDLSFASTLPAIPLAIYTICIQNDGKILIGGGGGGPALARLESNGTPDASFNPNLGFIFGRVEKIVVQNDKIYISGHDNAPLDQRRYHIVRLSSNGNLEQSFYDQPVVSNFLKVSFVVQSTSKIAFYAPFAQNSVPIFRFRRFNSNGSIDPTFIPPANLDSSLQPNLSVYDCTVQPDDKIITVGGQVFSVRRFNANGQADPTFATPSGSGEIYQAAMQPDGKIVLAGLFGGHLSGCFSSVARLRQDGSVDPEICTNHPLGGGCFTTLVRPDGKIFVAGGIGYPNILYSGTLGVGVRLGQLIGGQTAVPDASLQAISPITTVAGVPSLALTLSGANFGTNAISVLWITATGRVRLFPSSSTPTQLTTTIPANLLSSSGTVTISVQNVSSTSNSQTFTILNPTPTLTALAPSTTALSASTTLTLTGTNFVNGATLFVGGNAVPTTVQSATQLTATVPASALPALGATTVWLANPTPAVATSNTLLLNVLNPTPTLTTLAPSTTALSASTTLTLTGTNFVNGATLFVGGNAVPTTVQSATQLTATVPASALPALGAITVWLANPTPAVATSNTLLLNVLNPLPRLTALAPTQLAASVTTLDSLALTLTGAGFVPSSVVRLAGVVVPTTFVSATELRATFVRAGGSYAVTVTTPAPVLGAAAGNTATSASITLRIVNPAPTLTSLSANSTTATGQAGGQTFTLTLAGTGFVQGSQVLVSGVLPNVVQAAANVAVVSGTEIRLRLTVPIEATTLTIAVRNAAVAGATPTAGGGTTGALPFVVLDATPTIRTLTPSVTTATLGNAAKAWRLTLTGTNFDNDAIVFINNSPQPTQFVSAITLRVNVPEPLVSTAAVFSVMVRNPAANSTAATLTVTNPDPTLLAPVAPAPTLTALAGTETTLTLTGTGFTTTSTIRLISPAPATTTALAVSVLSPTQLSVMLPADVIQRVGAYSLVVVNPPTNGLGGGTSNALPLTVRAVQATQVEFANVTTAITAGNPLNAFTVRFRDAFGNLVANDVDVNFTNEDGSSTGTITLTRTGTVGVSTATAIRFYDAGNYRLSVAGIAVTTGTSTFVVNPNTDYRVEFVTIPATITADFPLPAFTLNYYDRNGNPTDNGIGRLTYTKAGTPSSTATLAVVRQSEGVYAVAATTCTVAGVYTVAVAGISTTNTVGNYRFAVQPALAASVQFAGVDADFVAGAAQTAFTATFRDAFGNLSDPTVAIVQFTNATSASAVTASSATITLTRTSVGVYRAVAQPMVTAGQYSLAVEGIGTTTGTFAFEVRPAAVLTATFAGVLPEIGVGAVQSAFTLTFRDRYGNLADHSGTVMFRNTSNATIMGSIPTTPTNLGVATATPTNFNTAGNYAFTVTGFTAANTLGGKTFVVTTSVGTETINLCASQETPIEFLSAEDRAIKEMQEIMANLELLKCAEATGVETQTEYRIPVVFHFVRLNAPFSPMTTSTLTVALAQQQLDILNQDFRRENPDAANTPARFQNVAAGSRIRFVLAQRDPDNNATTGIITVNEPDPMLAFQGYVRTLGGGCNNPDDGQCEDYLRLKATSRAWDPSRYLNIWVSDITGNLNDVAVGQARFPAMGKTLSMGNNVIQVDGIALDYRVVPQLVSANAVQFVATRIRPFMQGRVLTHEVGHWLNLRHTWGDGNQFSNPCLSDGVDDTPPQKISTFGACLDLNGCPPTNIPFQHQGFPCPDRDPALGVMFMNHMDISFDACKNIFTRGQICRTRAVFNTRYGVGGGRMEILNSARILSPVLPFSIALTTDKEQLVFGEAATCRVEASGGTDPYRYVWERRNIEGDGSLGVWQNILVSDATTEVQLTIPEGMRARQVRVTVTDGTGLVLTDVRTVLNSDYYVQLRALRSVAQLPTQGPSQRMLNPAPPPQLTAAPNPLSTETTLRYTLAAEATVTLEVVNALQQSVALIVNAQRQQAGAQAERFDASQLTNGIYTVRLITTSNTGIRTLETLRIVVMK